MKKLSLCLFLLFVTTLASAADVRRLKEVFVDNFDRFYEWRMCGKNIHTLVTEAQRLKIDLKNAYVAKIEGAGIWETSGFYTRGEINKRSMLGYFHVILVADGYVFDFDLAEPLVLKIEDYFRLQFTPPHEPYMHYGTLYDAKVQLPRWSVTRYETQSYLLDQAPVTWKKSVREYLNLDQMFKKKRIR